MTTSKTIAALLGPTLIASAISLLANLGTSRTIIEGLSQSPALIMIAGYAAFVPGLAIVYFHNRWTGGWPMLVTVMGWLSLVVGLLRMVFPTQIAALTMKIAPSAAGVFPVVAGTGRTIVALHGAAHLARTRPDARVLLTTFSDSLANALQKQAEAIAR